MKDEGWILPEMGEMWQQTLGWQPTSEQQMQFQQLFELILTGNRQLNLTRITDPMEFWEKHLWDSLAPLFLQPTDSQPITPLLPFASPCRAIDIGTGAGFPGIPAAIVYPNWTVTLLDSTRKKMAFLDRVLETIEIQNAKTLVDRAEQVGQNSHHRAAYDLVLIRAVAAASVCAEYALPMLKIGGVAVLYRGQWTPEEENVLERALAKLGGKLERIDRLTTPLSQGIRHCVYLKKVEATSAQFPRAVGVPVQKPL